jgi:S1-C subfamily serine protease
VKAERRARFDAMRRSVVAVGISAGARPDAGTASAPGSAPERFTFDIRASGVVVDVSETGAGAVLLTAGHVVDPYLAALRTAPARTRALSVAAGRWVQDETGEWVQDVVESTVDVVERHQRLDVAALGLLGDWRESPLRAAVIASGYCEDGDPIVACGFPVPKTIRRHHDDPLIPSFVAGIVSAALPFSGAPTALRRHFRFEAMTSAGNSGGPVFDAESGQVVGIASAIVPHWHDVSGSTVEDGDPSDGPSFAKERAGACIPVPTGLALGVYVQQAIPLIDRVRSRLARGG